MSGQGSACAEGLGQEGARPRHVTERSSMCLLNTEQGEAAGKAEIMGKAWKSGQTSIKTVLSLSN